MRHSAGKAVASESRKGIAGNQETGITGIARTGRTFKKFIQQGRSRWKHRRRRFHTPPNPELLEQLFSHVGCVGDAFEARTQTGERRVLG